LVKKLFVHLKSFLPALKLIKLYKQNGWLQKNG